MYGLAWLDFEHTDYDVVILHVNSYSTGASIQKLDFFLR